MVFQRTGKRIFELKVTAKDGRSAIRSCGTSDRETAEAVAGCVQWYRRKRRWDVLGLLVDKRLKLPDLYDAWDRSHDDAEALIRDAQTVRTVVDLRPHLTAFLAARKKEGGRGTVVAPEYVRMLKALYPESEPFTLDTFTADEIASRIGNLPHGKSTKTRYKAAASQFAAYLLEQKILTVDVTPAKSWGMNDPREAYHDAEDAQRLIAAMAAPFRGICAYAYACAAEWSAVEHVRVRDLLLDEEPPQALVPGTKNRWRRRWVPIVDELRWTVPYLREAVQGKLPDAPVWAWDTSRAMNQATLRHHQATCKALGLAVTTFHDWRHTHAVALLRWGYDEQIVASHLGHEDTGRVRDTYGRWLPKRSDYARKRPRPGSKVTSEVTSEMRRMK